MARTIEQIERMKLAQQDYINRISSLKRLSLNSDWKEFTAWLKEVCISDENAYIPGTAPEHTIFRCGCQQIWIELNNILKIDEDLLIKNYKKEFEDELIR